MFASGVVFAFIAFFGYGVGDFLAAIAAKRFSPQQALLVQKTTSITLLTLGLLLILPHQSATLTGAAWGFCASVVAYIGWTSFYAALRKASASIVVPIANIAFLWTVVLSIIFLRESFSSAAFFAAVFIFVGVFLVSVSDVSAVKNGSKNVAGILYACLTLFGWGTAFLFLKLSSASSGPYLATMYNEAGILAFALFSIVFSKEKNARLAYSKMFILIAGGLSFGIALLMINTAFALGNITIAGPITAASPALTAILAFAFLRERLLRHQYIGVASIIVGLILISVA